MICGICYRKMREIKIRNTIYYSCDDCSPDVEFCEGK